MILVQLINQRNEDLRVRIGADIGSAMDDISDNNNDLRTMIDCAMPEREKEARDAAQRIVNRQLSWITVKS